jgi:hypothetical protein
MSTSNFGSISVLAPELRRSTSNYGDAGQLRLAATRFTANSPRDHVWALT